MTNPEKDAIERSFEAWLEEYRRGPWPPPPAVVLDLEAYRRERAVRPDKAVRTPGGSNDHGDGRP